MNEKKLTVEAVKQREKNYSFKGEGSWYSGWGKSPVEIGDIITFEFEDDGKFKNVKYISNVDKSGAFKPVENKGNFESMNIRNNQTNAKICAMNNATTICTARANLMGNSNEVSMEMIFKEAREILAFFDGEEL